MGLGLFVWSFSCCFACLFALARALSHCFSTRSASLVLRLLLALYLLHPWNQLRHSLRGLNQLRCMRGMVSFNSCQASFNSCDGFIQLMYANDVKQAKESGVKSQELNALNQLSFIQLMQAKGVKSLKSPPVCKRVKIQESACTPVS